MWVTCDDASRTLAVAIMLLAAATDNKIPSDPAYLKRVAYLNKAPNLAPLVACQFIEIIDAASNVLAGASGLHTNARPETEKSREETEGEAPPMFLKLGEFGNVELTREQFDKLTVDFNGHLDGLIADLDRYGETKPKKFKEHKSHYATLQTWYRMRVDEGKIKPSIAPKMPSAPRPVY
jgi:hypothetical protein